MDYAASITVKGSNFTMTINHEKKAELEKLFGALGMTLPEAVNFFFESSLLTVELPFTVRLPRYSREAEEVMQETRDIMSGKIAAKAYSSVKELFDELDSE